MKTMKILSIIILPILLLSACIKDDFIDDFVETELRITTVVESIALGSDFQFDYAYFNNVGQKETVDVVWTSSNPEILSITPDGFAQANVTGEAIITIVTTDEDGEKSNSIVVTVGFETIESTASIVGQIVTTSFYVLEGSFQLSADGSDLKLEIGEDYEASSSLPGLYVYLSNNKNSIGNAKEISDVKVFKGAHSYTIKNTELTDFKYIVYYCKPFNVKVGEASLK